MKIAVLGAGAMGSLFGGLLSTRHAVSLIDPVGELVHAIRTSGLTISSHDGERTYHPKAYTDPAQAGEADLLIVFVKSTITKDAVKSARPLIGSHTLVMSLQNGYGNHEDLLKYVPREKIIIGTTLHGATLIEPGKIYHAGQGVTTFGFLDGIGPKEEIAEAFSACGIEMAYAENILSVIWSKLFVNVGINPLTAILNIRNRAVAENEHVKNLSYMLVKEAVETVNQLGYAFDLGQVFEKTVATAIRTGNNQSSMLQDVKRARKTEIDKINGAIVKKARELGFPVPYNEMAVQMVRAIESGYPQAAGSVS